MSEILSLTEGALLADEQELFDRLEGEGGALGVFPLSFTQERLWFLDQLEPGSPLYNIPVAVRLRGALEPALLRAALDRIAERHESLRTRFLAVGGRPMQAVFPPQAVPFAVADLAGVPGPVREAEAARLMKEEARRPFSLEEGPLLRALLLALDPDDVLLLLSLHHIVTDGWSNGILIRELTEIYGAALAGRPPVLPELPIQYADFAVWQRDWLSGGELEAQLSWWREQLAGLSPLELPADLPRPPYRGERGGLVPIAFDAGTSAALAGLARRQGVTLFTVLLGVFATVLQRWSGQDDFAVGSPVANRTRSEVESLVGCFMNTLVLRTGLGGDPPFHRLLDRLRETLYGAFAHQDLPFERLVEVLEPERNLSRTPLFQVMLILQNAPAGALRLPGAALETAPVDTGTAKFDLTLAVEETADGLAGSIEHSLDLFLPVTAERLAGHLRHLAAGVAADPARSLSELPLLGEAELRQVLEGWNDTAAAIPEGECLHHGIERQVDATPDAVAVRCGAASLTYRELDRRANRLAWRLRALGAGPEVPIGVRVERSPDMVVALLAVLKAGGAYVPMDPAYPAERLDLMAEDSGARQVVVRRRPERPPAAPLLVLDEIAGELAAERDDRPQIPVRPGNLAYALYTSGSTGRPKGVMIPHRNAVSFFAAMDRQLGGGPGVWLAVTSISFDISVLELLWTLARGFEVIVQEEGPRIEVGPAAPAPGAASRPLDFSLFYFASEEGEKGDGYRLLLDGARFADREGFAAVWTPERHFHAFGGLYPNPAVVGAAVAAVTERVQIRAGSVVLPLQSPLRVAEEWAVVDRLSCGRAGVSFASGWHADDFVLAPESFHDRKEVMLRGVDTVRRLWRGEAVTLPGGTGQPVEVRIHPRPLQPEIPIWLTAAGNPETFRLAGELRAGVLTHLLGQGLDDLAEKIALYREAWRQSGGEGDGRVTLMLHTFVGDDLERVRETVRQPFCGYLRTSLGLVRNLARGLGMEMASERLSDEDERALLDHLFDRFFLTAGLMGTLDTCLGQLAKIRALGVDEVACLIDFGVETGAALAALEKLRELRDRDRERARSASPGPEAPLRLREATHFQCTPSMARMLSLEPEALAALGSLRTLVLGGEALPADLARRLREGGTGEIHNVYGPTETTVWSTGHRIDEAGGTVPIGRPLANNRAYVLDAGLRPAPVGVPGELYLGGEGVARGYLARPALTAERFLPDPFGPHSGGRLYRTGDRVRWRAGGTLEFLGRADHQVKIRGFRIEPGEVEAALLRHPGIAEAVVVAREDRPGDRRLAAYFTAPPGHGAGPSVGELRDFLAGSLPEHMIPAAFVGLDALPRTPNGKLDRRALPAPEGERPRLEVAYEEPATELQKTVAAVWREVLAVERVGLHDNFFELGGSSLSLVEVRARLRSATGLEVSLVDMFRAPTVASLARFAGERREADGEDGASPASSYDDVRERARRRRTALRRRGAGEAGAS